MRLLLLPFLLLTNIALAQKNYGSVSGFYHNGTNRTFYGYNNTDGSVAEPAIGGAAGGKIIYGHSWLDFFATELAVTYANGFRTPVYAIHTNDYFEMATNQVILNPSAVATAHVWKLNLYLKTGLVIPIYNHTTKYIGDDSGIQIRYEIQNCFRIGLNGSLGIGLNLNQHWEIFIEAEESNLSGKHDKGTVTYTSPNNTPTTTPIQYTDNGVAGGYAATPLSFNRSGLNLGVKFSF